MKILVALFLVAALARGASAQQVLFQDSFENGLGAWTTSGLWNLETSTDPCGATFGPFPDGAKIAWYGVDGACDFDNGLPNSGSLALGNWIALPSNAASISLRYWSSSESEYCNAGYDRMAVRVDAQNGPDSGFTQSYCPNAGGPITIFDLPWHERRIDLSAYRGALVRFAFEFDSVDDLNNEYRGWLVDDVRVLVEPGVRVCPPITFGISGCPCGPNFAGGCRNSTGQSATLFSEGAPSLSADTLRFNAVLMPASTTALLVQGTTMTAPVVFGDGARCVGGTIIRLGTAAATGGSTSWPQPGANPISVRGQVPSAGSARFYFAWYRDGGAYCTPAQFNVTDAQRIDWAP